MPITEVVDLTRARDLRGLRVVAPRGRPIAWVEAAKGILHAKGIPFALAHPSPEDPPELVAEWIGDGGFPVVAYRDERLRRHWSEILLLAERLAPHIPLVAKEGSDRALLFGIGHEICGEMGLGWCARLLIFHASLSGDGPLPREEVRPLARKYGYRPDALERARERLIEVLSMLRTQLASQRERGGSYLVGSGLSAADIYWATFANLLIPLPAEDLPLPDALRTAMTCRDEEILEAMGEDLRAHQRSIYESTLELPVRV